jgi:hypothetical protein
MADIVTLLSAVAAPGAGPVHDCGDVKAEFTMQIPQTAATFSVQLQGSLNNTDWYSLGSAAAAVGAVAASGTLARWVRANVASVSGGSVSALLGFGGGL